MWTIPNTLTVARILAAPALALIFAFVDRPLADWIALALFIIAALTDFLDGWLARRLNQISEVGKMLDPIADKAMVVIALMVIIGFSSWSPWLVLPATVILFREVFVSGLREYLGDVAGTLQVTKLAKWKTTVQLIAIAFLLAGPAGDTIFAYTIFGMDDEMIAAILNGEVEDVLGLQWKFFGMEWSGRIGLMLLWVAAALTAITGYDYLMKSLPHLKEGR